MGYSSLYGLFVLNNMAVNVAAFFLINIVLVISCYNCTLKAVLLHTAFLTFSMVIAEILIALLLTYFKHEYTAYTYDLSVLIVMSITSKLLYFFMAIVGARVFGMHKLNKNEPMMLLLLCSVPFASLIVAFTVTYIGVTAELVGTAEVLVTLSVLSLLLINFLVFIVYNRIQVLNEERMVLRLNAFREQADIKYYEMLQKQYENQRVLLHDIKNHLSVLHALAERNDCNGISQYISDLGSLSFYGNGIQFCDQPILNIVLLSYHEQCIAHQISFDCDIRANTIQFMDAASITSLFGNLLSNAIEAAVQSKERLIELSVVKSEPHDVVILSLCNSCDVKPIIDKNGNIRTRKDNPSLHGFGTKSIDRIVKNYHGAMVRRYDEQEKRFYCVIRF